MGAAIVSGGSTAQTIGTPALMWEFFKMGATSIGDLAPLLAFIEHDLVDQRKVLTRADVTEALTYTKLLPGSTVLQVVAYLSYKLGGWRGSALASLVYLLPSAVLMVALAAGFGVLSANVPEFRAAVHGVTAAVVGVLLATTLRFARKNLSLSSPITVLLAVAAFTAAGLGGVNVAIVMLASGLVGVVVLRGAPK